MSDPLEPISDAARLAQVPSVRTFLGDDVDLTAGKETSLWMDLFFSGLVRLFALLSVAVMVWMAVVILQQAMPAIQEFGLAFLWTQEWDIGALVFGGLPYIYGTLITSAIALLLAIPIGLAVAIVTSENFLPIWVRSPLAFLVELIAAIPSVIIGLWGIFIFIPFLLPISTALYQRLGWIPLFGTEPFGPGMMTAGIVLAIMILPTIAAISRDVLLAVPSEIRSASSALGATRWETIIRVMLPASASGILGAATLALGRALGETMAVTMVIGNSTLISPSLLAPASTIPSVLANQFAEALDELHIGALMYLALILFVLTLTINIIAVYLVQAIGHSYHTDV